MFTHSYRKYLLTICKSAIAIAGALIPGCAQHVTYPVNSDMSQEDTEQSSQEQNAPAQSADLSDTTAPRFLLRPSTKEVPSQWPFIETYSIKANVVGMFVQIETELTVRNPNARPYAGVLKVPLPEGAVVTGYAIDITTEDIHHQMVDAVVVSSGYNKTFDELDTTTTNSFSADIDLILPRGYRQIRMTYIMPLKIASDGSSSVLLPMKKTKLRSCQMNVSVDIHGIEKPSLSENIDTDFVKKGTAYILEHTDKNITADNDIRLSIPALPNESFYITKYIERDQKYHDDIFYMLGINIGKNSTEPRDLSKIRLIWDASGNRTPEDVQKSLEVLKRLPENAQYELHVFRNIADDPKVFSSRVELIHYLETIAYDGGTNYEPLQAIAKTEYDGITLFFSDGLDTYKHTIPEFGVKSSALLSGNSYDMRVLWSASHGHIIDLNTMSPDEAFAEIRSPKLAVYNVTGAHISELQGLKPYAQDRITVMGKWDGLSDSVTITLSDGSQHTVNLSENDDIHTGRTIATAWAIDRVRDLSVDLDNNERELIDIGRKYSVVSPVTEMVVLTTAKDWKFAGIEPPEYLTKVHDEYVKDMQDIKPKKAQNKSREDEKSSEAINDLDDSGFEPPDDWADYLDWWKDPIPKGLEKTYHCPNNDLSKCTMTVSSVEHEPYDDRHIHYTVPFKPPKNWTCNEMIKCYSKLDDADNSEHPKIRIVYGPGYPQYNSRILIGTFKRNDAKQVFRLIDDETMDWDAETPYLKALATMRRSGANAESLYAEYLKWRLKYSKSMAFYFEVACFFADEKMHEYALRILTNLLEPGIESDTGLIGRVYVQRLINAGELDEAEKIAELFTSIVGKTFGWRHIMVTIWDMRARRSKNPEDAQRALELYSQFIVESKSLDAFIEFNALKVWVKQQKYDLKIPEIPNIDEDLNQPMDADLRIVAAFDDHIHNELIVIEPTTETLRDSFQRSAMGGLKMGNVYTIKKADKGSYIISVVIGEHEWLENIIGNKSVTVTIYRNWGRPNQTQEVIVKRLDDLQPFESNKEEQSDEEDEAIYQIGVVKIK